MKYGLWLRHIGSTSSLQITKVTSLMGDHLVTLCMINHLVALCIINKLKPKLNKVKVLEIFKSDDNIRNNNDRSIIAFDIDCTTDTTYI